MPPESHGPVYASGECEIDLARRELRILGLPVPIGGRAFEVIEVLAESAGELVTKNELLDRIWPGAVVSDNTLHVHAVAVRKALGPFRHLLKTVSGRGYRLLGNWSVRRHDASKPPVGVQLVDLAGENAVTNFPATVSRLVGRTAAVAQLRDRLSAYRLVTVTGPGGIGKTSIAMKAARGILGDFRNGGWLAELGSLSDPDLVPSAVAQALGIRTGGETITAAILARAAGSRQLLLVLDNCEHLIDAAAELADILVRQCPHITILATSREALRIEGEAIFRLPPLEVPAPDQDNGNAILGRSAVELFIARAAERDFASSAAELSEIAAICRQLDGIPLAIEFAAARVATLGVSSVAAGLRDRFALLTSGRRTAPPRHRTLRATLDWSYQLLSDPERALFRRLAIFTGGFTIEAVAAVMQGTGADTLALMDGVASLAAKSMIVLDTTVAGPRWRVLETIRAYALTRLSEHGEAEDAARRHAEYFRDLIVPAAGNTEPQVSMTNLAVYGRELDNVRGALDWSFSAAGDPAVGATLMAAFAPVWVHFHLVGECRQRAEQMLQIMGPEFDPGAALARRFYLALCFALAMTLAPVHQVRTYTAKLTLLIEGVDDVDLRFRMLWHQWSAEVFAGEYTAALAIAWRLAALAPRAPDRATALLADRWVGTSLLYVGRLREAKTYLERMIANYVTPPSGHHASLFHFDQILLARSKLPRILYLQGYLDQALEQARRSFAAAQALAAGFTPCWVLQDGVCPVALMIGDLELAERAVATMKDIAARIDAKLWVNVGNCWEGKLLVRRQQYGRAAALLRETLELCEQTGWQFCNAEFLGDLVQALIGLGQRDAALDTVDRAIARAERYGEGYCAAELHRLKGEVLLQEVNEGSVAAAEQSFQRAAVMAREQGALTWELRIAVSFARLRVIQGRAQEARRLLGPVYQRFTEGFGMSDLRAAAALLATLDTQPG